MQCNIFYLLFSLCILNGLATAIAAQPITPTPDATGTVVTPTGEQFDISGGTQAGRNLFHSFQQFNLEAHQGANFVIQPDIQTILGRVTGGDPSYINGWLQVSGGQANLLLMNPAGIVFGPGARLNVPAAFTATTANAIALGGGWFNASGPNDYTLLTGDPQAFAFLTAQPGAIFNSAQLAVQPGQALTLLGGRVINTGTLQAPGGQITVAAVPGEGMVQIREAGSLLNLELPIETRRSLLQSAQPLTGVALPQLLTGGQLSSASGVTVANGQVTLTQTQTPLPIAAGTTVVSGTVSTAAPASDGSLVHGGTIQVLGNTIGLLGATLDASGAAGGHIFIGGDFQGQGTRPNAEMTVIDGQTTIRADARSTTAPANGGTVIVWANDTTRFQGFVSATGAQGGDGGFVETSGKKTLDIAGGRVNAQAPQGRAGTWLLDPTDIDITATGTGLLTGGLFDPPTTGVASQIAPVTIENALNGGTNVTITTASGNGGNGDITLSDPINQTGGGAATLTLTSRRFLRPGTATINLTSTGGLTFNLNAVNPEAIAPSDSIQAAIAAIGDVAGDRTIQLGAGTYQGTAAIAIDKSVTLRGAGAAVTTLTNTAGLNAIRLPGGTGATVTLENMAIANNASSAIYNDATLRINNSSLRNNTAAQGGALYNDSQGRLTLTNTQIQGNTSNSIGGGIYNLGSLTLLTSDIASNRASSDGGGIYSGGNGTLSLQNSTVQGNIANGNGGGIFNSGFLWTDTSTVANNTASGGLGGGVYTNGPASLTNTTLDRNQANDSGGGIYNGGVLSLVRSTLSNNIANLDAGVLGDGGGLYNSNVATITNSTISANRVINGSGGGIYSSDNLTLSHSTLTLNIADGQGGGIRNTGTATISNTIVANNGAATHQDVSGLFNSQGNNLVGVVDGGFGFGSGPLIGTAARPINPGLGPLADNGGPTRTHALLPGSPALNAGNATNPPATDQRGFARVLQGFLDIGAIESDLAPLVPANPSTLPSQNQPLVPAPSTLSVSDRTAIAEVLDRNPTRVRLRSVDLQKQTNDAPTLDTQAVDQSSGQVVSKFDQTFSSAYRRHLNLPDGASLNLAQLQATLSRARRDKGVNTGIIYAVFVPRDADPNAEASASATQPQADDQLQLILVTASGEPIRRSLPVTRAYVTAQAKLFKLAVADPADDLSYMPLARQFYGWLLQPLAAELQAQGISSLIYCLDEGLRTIPLAAMLDDEQFVIEQYTLAVIPSVALTNLAVTPLKSDRLLAMGAATFTTQDPLPAVPLELDLVSQRIAKSAVLLNEKFTLATLTTAQVQQQPDILHLATHAQFHPGNVEQSYIQLWDTRLNLNQVRSLNWQNTGLSLLILSACTTALSSREAELGFAGLASVSGVRSVLGSLWMVSDVGTLALMQAFYAHLNSESTVAEALRKAQLALLTGSVRIQKGRLQSQQQVIALPGLSLPDTAQLSHPFYWSSFILVGNPW